MNWWQRLKAAWDYLRTGELPFTLVDHDYKSGSVTGKLIVKDQGIGFHFDGYSMLEMADSWSQPVWIEKYNGKLTVSIWPDCQDADCETISLEDARVTAHGA